MSQEIWLAALGILCSVIGGLMLLLMGRVLKQGDDTNKKVTDQGVTLAEVKTSVTSHEARLNSLHEWRNELQRRELDKATRELEDERRKTTRREEDRE